jgi:hypothetical protein
MRKISDSERVVRKTLLKAKDKMSLWIGMRQGVARRRNAETGNHYEGLLLNEWGTTNH